LQKSSRPIGKIVWTSRSSGCQAAGGPDDTARDYGTRVTKHLKIKERKQSCHVVEEEQAADRDRDRDRDRVAVLEADAGEPGADRGPVQGCQVPASVRPVEPKPPMNAVSLACR
jgi:hypothetical protein